MKEIQNQKYYYKTFLVIFIYLSWTSMTFSQELVSTSGGSLSNSSTIIDFSIGEVVIETVGSSSTTLTQGFQQSNISITSTNIVKYIDINVYPTVVNNEFVIKSDVGFLPFEYNLLDINGKTVLKNFIHTDEEKVSTHGIPSGTYILKLKHNKSRLNTYKLIIK